MSIETSIEKARPEHLPEILDILIAGATALRAGQESGKVEDYRTAFDVISASPDADIYVALGSKGEVLGTYHIFFLRGLAFRGAPRVELESVHTRADARGQGIGAKMMAHAEQLARTAGASMMQLTSNRVRTDAHRFYVRLGFDQSHLGFKKML